jgi:transposase InsO family protein
LLIPETRWRAREEAIAATAGPKRREGIAAEARHHEKRSKLARIHRAFKLLAEKSIDFDRRSGNDRRM